jgi:hypothetical protein
MKILLLAFSLLISSFSQNHQIKSFNELLKELKLGSEVRLVVEYKKCKLFIDSVEVNSVDAIGGMNISTFEYFAKGSIKNEKSFIAFSENVLISHKRYGYVYNYVKFRVYEDEQVEIVVRYLKTHTFEAVMDEVFHCQINNLMNDGGVYFFKK